MDIDSILSKEDINSNDMSDLIEFKKSNDANFVIIDVREDFEVQEGYIEGCDLFYPTSNFNDYMPELEKLKDKHIVLYCRSGGRTSQVKSFLKQQGFNKVSHLAGGITGYFGSIVTK